jgi:AraC-like DNA-binding protein
MHESQSGLFRLSTDDYPEDNRVEAVREGFGRSIIKILIEPSPGHRFHFDTTFCALPDVSLAVGVISPMRGSLTKDLVDSDDILFNITLSGGRILRQLGREAVIGPGDGGVTTSAEPGVVTVHSASRFVSFRIARDKLRPIVGDLDACLLRTIPRDSTALHLLTSYAGLIEEGDNIVNSNVASLVAGHFRDLIAVALGATRDAAEMARARGGGIRAARLRAIKSDILENLPDADLSVGLVARRHGITPRYLRMLFADDETSFTGFVLNGRLGRAHAMLSNPSCATSTISTIAFTCGFGDLSYFNRAFRRRYGMTPSDAREATQAGFVLDR